MLTRSALEIAQEQLLEAAQLAGASPEIVQLLAEPQRVLEVQFPVKMDNGTTKFFKGFRVHHNYVLGPIQGGTRFHPEETLEDIKALSLWMSIKNAVNQLPAGGGKGGIKCNPSELSKGEKERLCRAYVRAIAPMLGAMKDFPGADIGTDIETQSWMLDEWEQMHGMRHEPAAFSGKGLLLGGSAGRPSATGLGVSLAVIETCAKLGKNLAGLEVAVQGFGKVGSWAASLLSRKGAKIVGVSDIGGFIHNANGLDPDALLKYTQEHNSVDGFPGGKSGAKEQIFSCPCDVLIPAAVQSAISEDNASDIKAKIIVEGANGPITPNAEKLLNENGVVVVPDILANGGGTVIAYLERVQGTYNYYWTEKEVHIQYEKMFKDIYNQLYSLSSQKKISMRMAAWSIAISRIEEGVRLRGWI
ncbi:Glu/Leu/Phe/Val dehydrogenase [Metallumcola ferriviriculae]|uniref:Glutamate dehydrogenase n=1 Tax=Metallumcola ferriviriculae TaxID=3039180 RepID=A0AAU0USE4_9FIRM|nr:Glu/Leu/Phe/Val dehydrogenase [Desulfitibacteraceae bacterium MK1]